jgi:hypothetical protein
MDFLDGKRAHSAVSRALAHDFIIPDTGTRTMAGAIDFEVYRRGQVLGDRMIYRVRLSEGDVLLGHFVGEFLAQEEGAR